MEFGSDVLYVSKELEEEEIEELDYYSPSAAPAPGSYVSAPVKTKYKPSKSGKYKDDGKVSLRPSLESSGMSNASQWNSLVSLLQTCLVDIHETVAWAWKEGYCFTRDFVSTTQQILLQCDISQRFTNPLFTWTLRTSLACSHAQLNRF